MCGFSSLRIVLQVVVSGLSALGVRLVLFVCCLASGRKRLARFGCCVYVSGLPASAVPTALNVTSSQPHLLHNLRPHSLRPQPPSVALMSSLRDVKARLGAARLVLARPSNPEVHRSISALQANAVLEVAGRARHDGTVSAGELAELAVGACDINFAAGDLEKVLAVLTEVKPAQTTKRRRAQQNYLSILQYGTAAMWSSFQKPGDRNAKLLDILNLRIKLGLRLPSEHTLKLIASWWAVVSETEDARRAMEPQVDALSVRQG